MKTLSFVFAFAILQTAPLAQAQLDERGQMCGALTQMKTGREMDLGSALKSLSKLSTAASKVQFDDAKRDLLLGQVLEQATEVSRLKQELIDLSQAQNESCD